MLAQAILEKHRREHGLLAMAAYQQVTLAEVAALDMRVAVTEVVMEVVMVMEAVQCQVMGLIKRIIRLKLRNLIHMLTISEKSQR